MLGAAEPNIPVSKIKIKVAWTGGSPTGNVFLELWDLDGSDLPTGSALATSDNIAASSLSTFSTFTEETFVFSTLIPLRRGKLYGFSLDQSAAFGSSHCMFKSSTSSTYADGVVLNEVSSSWSEVSAQDASPFTVLSPGDIAIITHVGSEDSHRNVKSDANQGRAGQQFLMP
jgi:hypothetical protein